MERPVDTEKKELLSDFLATNVIGLICRDEFTQNSALKSLMRSSSFFGELYSLFGLFKTCDITSADLQKALESADISEVDMTRLLLIFNVFKKYCETLEKYNYLDKTDVILNEKTTKADKNHDDCAVFDSDKANPDILKRAKFLLEKYGVCPESGKNYDFDETEAIKYLEFEDVSSEISYIADEISQKVKAGGCKFSDFAVLVRDFDSKQNFIDIFKTSEIPISDELYNESYENFKMKLTRYLSICEVCEKLGVQEFLPQGFAGVTLLSRAQKEILFDELNLYIQNIISEILHDSYLKDRFITIQEESNNLSLISVIYENMKILSREDVEKLRIEFDSLAKIYGFYLARNPVGLVEFVAGNQNSDDEKFTEVLNEFSKRLKSLDRLYLKINGGKFDFNSLKELLSLSYSQKSSNTDAVSFLTFSKILGSEFKYIYMPCLGENTFPKKFKATYFISPDANEKISDEIRKIAPDFGALIDENIVKEEIRLFCQGMIKAKDRLVLSVHRYDEKKQIQPSVFFQLLVDVDGKNYSIAEISQSAPEKYEFTGQLLAETPKTAILDENEVLYLSPSAISNFLSCPRKYYYKNLLNLKETGTFSANYGTIVHAVMEVFNKHHLKQYTPENLKRLSEILFTAKIDPEAAIKAGFEKYIDLIDATDELDLEEMKENFFEAIENMHENGFFEHPPDEVLAEKSFKFCLDELPNVVFDGKIDAICKKNGEYEIIDYKTGKNKNKTLGYYLSDYGVNFQGDFRQNAGVFNEKYIKEYDYQIPLYYLACQNSEELSQFKDKVKTLALKYIRPSDKDGYNEDVISAEAIDAQKEKLICNLKETVIEKIKAELEFSKALDEWRCASCSFAFLCNQEEDKDEE